MKNIQHLSGPNHPENIVNLAAADLVYYGGPVVGSAEVHPLFWGAAQFESQINQFYAQVTKSAWLGRLQEYNTPTTTITFGSAVSGISPTVSGSTTLDDTNDIQPWLTNLVSTGVISPSANTYFPIHFAPGISITQGGQGSCQVFCAYHGTIDISSVSGNNGQQYLYYGVMPDQGGSCAGGCGSAPTVFQNLCSVSSHELAETITDAAVGVATVIGSPLAWYDQTNGEIGDICNAQQSSFVGCDGTTYTIQTLWSNQQAACTASNPKFPNNDCGGSTVSTSTVSASTSKSTSKSVSKSTSTTHSTSTKKCHSECVTGAALSASCGVACVTEIIAQDPYCGQVKWDSICVSEVGSICGITC